MFPSRRSAALLALTAASLVPAALADGQTSSPTSADQCKDGGWRAFTSPAFKNQGECISFVAALGTPGAGGGPAAPTPGSNAGGNGNGAANANPNAGKGTTDATPGDPTPAPAPTVPDTKAAPTPAPLTATPALGESSVAQVESGTVKIKLAGARTFTALEDGVVPLGATVDATDGTISVATALPGGRTQTATFWGGAFTLTQSRAGGYVDVTLPKVTRNTCAAAPTAFAAGNGTRKPKPKSALQSLWVKDSGGKYRTRGSNSVASVRGTEWVTRERCEGTFTYVRDGRVDVRNTKTGRVTAVTAGHGVLARN